MELEANTFSGDDDSFSLFSSGSTTLKSLTLVDNTGSLLPYADLFKNLYQLQELHISSNTFDSSSSSTTTTLPTELGLLTTLTSLDWNDGHLEGTIPTELGHLLQLTTLSLAGNDLTGTIPNQLGQLSAMEYMNVSHNQLTGTIPSTLRCALLLHADAILVYDSCNPESLTFQESYCLDEGNDSSPCTTTTTNGK